MAKHIYIGNLSYDTTEETLRAAFAAYGEVISVNIVTDRYSGRPRDFAFVEMESDDDAAAAIGALNGQPLDGRQLRVDEARPQKSRWSTAFFSVYNNFINKIISNQIGGYGWRWVRPPATDRQSCRLPRWCGHADQG